MLVWGRGSGPNLSVLQKPLSNHRGERNLSTTPVWEPGDEHRAASLLKGEENMFCYDAALLREIQNWQESPVAESPPWEELFR